MSPFPFFFKFFKWYSCRLDLSLSQGWERGPFSPTPQWRPGERPPKHSSLTAPNRTGQLAGPPVQPLPPTVLPAWLFRPGLPLRPLQDGAARLTGASVRLAETICVPVTVPSLLHCLPAPRRLAAGRERPMEETPFRSKVRPSPAQMSCGLAEQLPTLAWPSPSPETVSMYYFGV